VLQGDLRGARLCCGLALLYVCVWRPISLIQVKAEHTAPRAFDCFVSCLLSAVHWATPSPSANLRYRACILYFGVSAKIEVSWMKPACDDSCGQMRVSIRSWQYAAAFFSASPEKLHRPKFDCPLHFDILNIYQIRTGNFNARARHLPFASLLWWKSITVYSHGFGMPHMRQARCVLQSTDVPWSLDLSFHYTRAKATCHVCRDKITLEFVPTNWSVSAKTNWIKCFVN